MQMLTAQELVLLHSKASQVEVPTDHFLVSCSTTADRAGDA